jgi:Icc-related predicted phosphoesterase
MIENKKKKTKIALFADTHGNHDLLTSKIPNDVDILIFAGDFTHFGKKLIEFNDWLGKLPQKLKIVTRGNHENVFNINLNKILTNATVLENDFLIFNEISIFGIPFFFNDRITINDIKLPFDKVNKKKIDIDIFITHQPPFGFLDNDCGCKKILEVVNFIKPSFCVFGHIHKKNGIVKSWDSLKKIKEITFVNATCCIEEYKIGFGPTIIEIEK